MGKPDIAGIKKRMLKQIKPSDDEMRDLFHFSETLKQTAKSYVAKYGGEPVICGSTGKNTHLSGDHDIDLFIVFPRGEELKEKIEVFKEIVEDLGGSWEVSYAEHPYLRAEIGKYRVDIVPCHKMKMGEKISSSVDRSPLHLEFVLNNLTDDMKDDVRLLKHFLKSNSLYGSDLKTSSLSGYVLEVMVHHLGSFEKVMDFFSRMRYGDTIGSPKKRFYDPLVVVDPVDPWRNTASALSLENFLRIREVAKMFLETGSWKFKPVPIPRKTTEFLFIKFDRPDIIDDTLWPQMRKMARRIVKHLEAEDINTYGWFVHAGRECTIGIEVQKFSEVMKIVGPPVSKKENCRKFIEKHRKCWVESSRIVCLEERKEKNYEDLLRRVLKEIGDFSIDLSSFRLSEKPGEAKGELEKYLSRSYRPWK